MTEASFHNRRMSRENCGTQAQMETPPKQGFELAGYGPHCHCGMCAESFHPCAVHSARASVIAPARTEKANTTGMANFMTILLWLLG